MKIITITLVLALWGSMVMASPSSEPQHTANEILLALYAKAGVSEGDVKVVVFEYDYLKGQWHVEVSPADTSCIDCYPAFYINNVAPIEVRAEMHG